MVLNILTLLTEYNTNSSNELRLGDKVGVAGIELPEQSLTPVPIFVEEEHKILNINLFLRRTVSQVIVD